jgi:membrane fusion protein (multidrug efflux system)
MMRRFFVGSRSPAAPLVLVLSLMSAFMTGCRKKEAAAGPPPGAFASTVAVAPVVVQPIAETLAVVGTLMANEYVEIEAETDGTVAEILFQEGQPVKKGDLLVLLDETKFAASLAEAEANFKLSETTYERVKSLLRDNLISPQESDQAAATYHANKATVELRRRLLKDARIYAPFAGVVGSRLVSPGQVIKQMGKNTTITTLVDLDTVKAEFHVPERFLSELRAGQAVEIKAAAFPKETFKGDVFFLAPQVDAATRTLLVKARIPNESRRLRPGMFVNLDLTLTLKDNALVIPESALVSQGDRTFVYVISPTNTAELRPVTVGLRLPNKLEVTRGLEAGETVVAEGLQKVRPGGAVKAAGAGN